MTIRGISILTLFQLNLAGLVYWWATPRQELSLPIGLFCIGIAAILVLSQLPEISTMCRRVRAGMSKFRGTE